MTPAIATAGLGVSYGSRAALADVTVTIPAHTITGLVGPNGSGKSTFAKAVLGLVPATGWVSVCGRPLGTALRAGGMVGYVPQAFGVDLDFPVTAGDVVLMGTYGRLGWFRRPGRRERAAARAAMERTGVDDLASRPIGELSGGQRQRVFLARALAQDPDVLVLDEPFTGIDLASEAAITDVLRRLEATTVLLVHHDLAAVRALCGYAVVLKNGRLVAQGPDVLDRATLSYAFDLPELSS